LNSRISLGLKLQGTESSVVEKRESKVLELGDENGSLLVRVDVEISNGLWKETTRSAGGAREVSRTSTI